MRHRFCTAVPDALDTVRRTYQRLRNCAILRMINYSAKLFNPQTMSLLPPSSTTSQRYNLRHHAHSLQLPKHSTQLLSDSDFLTYMLYTLRTLIRPRSLTYYSNSFFFMLLA